MTISEERFNIKKVAIIGGGVAGIAALYELLHTTKDGKSTVGGDEPINPAFPEVTLFERSDQLGGNWHYSKKSDPKFPSQEILDAGNYNEPDTLDSILKSIPSDEELKTASFNSPITTERDETVRWSNSAAYLGLFSNIIAPLVRLPNALKYYDHASHQDRPIHPFSTAGEIQRDVIRFVKENNLAKHIRFQTTVERARKVGGKWEVVLRRHNSETGKDEWYQDIYDGIITANGHYSVPFVPFVENLNLYNKRHPDDIWHTKGIKDFKKFQGQDVLVIGSHASGIDVLKFLVSTGAKSITVSRRSIKPPEKRTGYDDILDLPEIKLVPKVEKYVINDNEEDDHVQFIDGTTGKYDKIIYGTGYHFHYPFLVNKELIQLGKIKDDNSKYSLVKTLYLYAFAVPDPTFATIGIQQSPYLWATMETQAAAIAGVWSNHSKLPSKEEQYDWVTKRNEAGEFHIFNIETVRNLADPAAALAPEGRIHPFDVANISKDEVHSGWDHAVRIFNLFKTRELTFDKVRQLDESKKALTFDPEEIVYVH